MVRKHTKTQTPIERLISMMVKYLIYHHLGFAFNATLSLDSLQFVQHILSLKKLVLFHRMENVKTRTERQEKKTIQIICIEYNLMSDD